MPEGVVGVLPPVRKRCRPRDRPCSVRSSASQDDLGGHRSGRLSRAPRHAGCQGCGRRGIDPTQELTGQADSARYLYARGGLLNQVHGPADIGAEADQLGNEVLPRPRHRIRLALRAPHGELSDPGTDRQPLTPRGPRNSISFGGTQTYPNLMLPGSVGRRATSTLPWPRTVAALTGARLLAEASVAVPCGSPAPHGTDARRSLSAETSSVGRACTPYPSDRRAARSTAPAVRRARRGRVDLPVAAADRSAPHGRADLARRATTWSRAGRSRHL